MRVISSLKVILGACVALPLVSSLALAQPGPRSPGFEGHGMHRPPPPPHRHYHWRHHHRVYD